MLIVVDPGSGVPVYRQLIDQLKFHIASGLLRPGAELPSTRALSSRLGVNPMTISKAYSILERDGVLERRPGRPLLVRTFGSQELQDQKIQRLRESLVESVRISRQLSIPSEQALDEFRRLLDGNEAPGKEGSE